MARYFTVYQNPANAMQQAFRESTRLGKSQSVYVPTGTDEPFYLVGDTSAAEGMREAGAVPLMSIQSHAPKCFELRDERPEGHGMACWEDLEAEVDRAP